VRHSGSLFYQPHRGVSVVNNGDPPAGYLKLSDLLLRIVVNTTEEEMLEKLVVALNIIWEQMAVLLGHGGVRNIFERAFQQIQNDHLITKQVQVGETQLDISSSLSCVTSDCAQFAIAIGDALTALLVRLLGPGLVQAILKDVERKL
jgi:hypothetical protein